MENNKFKSDPYNSRNRKIQVDEILNLMKSLNIEYQVRDISLFQTAFVHKSYTNLQDYKEYTKPDDCCLFLKNHMKRWNFWAILY